MLVYFPPHLYGEISGIATSVQIPVIDSGTKIEFSGSLSKRLHNHEETPVQPPTVQDLSNFVLEYRHHFFNLNPDSDASDEEKGCLFDLLFPNVPQYDLSSILAEFIPLVSEFGCFFSAENFIFVRIVLRLQHFQFELFLLKTCLLFCNVFEIGHCIFVLGDFWLFYVSFIKQFIDFFLHIIIVIVIIDHLFDHLTI